jgi:hypothetical protein
MEAFNLCAPFEVGQAYWMVIGVAVLTIVGIVLMRVPSHDAIKAHHRAAVTARTREILMASGELRPKSAVSSPTAEEGGGTPRVGQSSLVEAPADHDADGVDGAAGAVSLTLNGVHTDPPIELTDDDPAANNLVLNGVVPGSLEFEV